MWKEPPKPIRNPKWEENTYVFHHRQERDRLERVERAVRGHVRPVLRARPRERVHPHQRLQDGRGPVQRGRARAQRGSRGDREGRAVGPADEQVAVAGRRILRSPAEGSLHLREGLGGRYADSSAYKRVDIPAGERGLLSEPDLLPVLDAGFRVHRQHRDQPVGSALRVRCGLRGEGARNAEADVVQLRPQGYRSAEQMGRRIPLADRIVRHCRADRVHLRPGLRGDPSDRRQPDAGDPRVRPLPAVHLPFLRIGYDDLHADAPILDCAVDLAVRVDLLDPRHPQPRAGDREDRIPGADAPEDRGGEGGGGPGDRDPDAPREPEYAGVRRGGPEASGRIGQGADPEERQVGRFLQRQDQCADQHQ